MFFYKVDIQFGDVDFKSVLLKELIHWQDFDLLDIHRLFADPGTHYYRLEFIGNASHKTRLTDWLQQSGIEFHIKNSEHLLANRLLVQTPLATVSKKNPLEVTSEKSLKSTIDSLSESKQKAHLLTSHKIGLLSDGKRFEQTWTILPRLQRDSFLLNKYAGFYAEPIWIHAEHEEDFIKSICAMEHNYQMIRISSLNNDNSIELFDRISKSVSIPIVHAEYVENAILITAMLTNALNNRNESLKDKNIAILGIDTSSMGLTSLLHTQSPTRISGVDGNFRLLSKFEKQGGIASSLDNVYNNADVIVIMPDFQAELSIKKFHPEQMILNFNTAILQATEIPADLKTSIYTGNFPHPVSILPGLYLALAQSGIKRLETKHLLKLLDTLTKKDSHVSLLPLPTRELFSKQEFVLEGISKNYGNS